MKKQFLFLLIFFTSTLSALAQQPILPDHARMTGSDDTNRFWAIYDAQCEAVEKSTYVDYSAYAGTVINIAIPQEAHSIPLARHNDFHDMMLVVTNNAKNQTLFYAYSQPEPITLDAEQADNGDFSSVAELAEGSHLVMLTDNNPWIAERKGYGYSVQRQDLLFVENGIAENFPITSYNTSATSMQCRYVEASTDTLVFTRIHLRRHPASTFITCLASFAYQNNVIISNITVATPQYHTFKSQAREHILDYNRQWEALYQQTAPDITSKTKTRTKLEHDGTISISSCAHVLMHFVIIDGTYTIPGSYGYALSIGNTYDAEFNHVIADANWGVFGSNFMSKTTLAYCDLNRFDIHCYGRDVSCHFCTFRNKQTQFSSFYGKLEFNDCTFDNCVPVRIRGDYNAHTPFDIYFNRCLFIATRSHHHLVNVILYDTTRNNRPELSERHFPDVTINDMQVQMPHGVRYFDIYHPTKTTQLCKNGINNTPNVSIHNLTIDTPKPHSEPTIRISTTPIPNIIFAPMVKYKIDRE